MKVDRVWLTVLALLVLVFLATTAMRAMAQKPPAKRCDVLYLMKEKQASGDWLDVARWTDVDVPCDTSKSPPTVNPHVIRFSQAVDWDDLLVTAYASPRG